MTADEAVRLAVSAGPSVGTPADYVPARPRLMWIEVAPGASIHQPPPAPAPLRDVLAWLVRLSDGFGWIEIAVGDSDGRIVRVRRSR